MMTADTPIRTLVTMLDIIDQRNALVDVAEKRDDLSHDEWAGASRVWSRQQEALSSAIIAEPPQTFDDVLTVLTKLLGRHNLIIGLGEEATARDLDSLHEMTAVAVTNCVLRLAALFRPDAEPTDGQHQDLGWLSKQAGRWLPAREGR